ncbi:MAG: type II toxin-antitoxin system HicB family antitoxin [Planctomycetota bacterium]|jgi:predicted RNase H-like HicB family nuclease|uniref:type II toxin-antitoxin system HicB family antitoxin n=1 Tax=Candidatus Avalokitesvara rifleensis TaxID=3367620 RepID=UPI0027137870|nr:type II toxin-antitoxin system HicB family antitoxin [Candidatus Brocadiales bacterium]
MLTDYVQSAMNRAVYEKLEDGTYSGEIPVCSGTVAFGDTLSECQKNLQSALEDWILSGLRHGDELPVIDGIDLNKKSVEISD